MKFYQSLEDAVQVFFLERYSQEIKPIAFQLTRKEFEGDLTIVVFSYLKISYTSPKELGIQIGEFLVNRLKFVESFNVLGGFLNLSLSNEFYLNVLKQISTIKRYGFQNVEPSNETVLVEFSSPNTNKPLHLGHVRNNLLGHSLANILAANGKNVKRIQIVNDRGIHICKSMVAWKKFAKDLTPVQANQKSDHFVGQYYVEFETKFKLEVEQLMAEGYSENEAKLKSPLLQEAKLELRNWEKGDSKTIKIWKKLNDWVYKGFEETYQKLGVYFDKIYYESHTYLLGRKIVEKGLEKGVLHQKNDGSIWIDLTKEGLDEKLLIRSDGTTVYITQDIGTAVLRSKDFPKMNSMTYVVGNEQNYHFQVLFLILQKLNYPWAKNLNHLSYGMVDLPTGKMKSREGTVVDADELIERMVQTAENKSQESGKLEYMDQPQRQKLFHKIGLGALKYYLLKVDPQKRILFDPNKSIDFQGNTGTFIQYAYARISTLREKFGNKTLRISTDIKLHSTEKKIIKKLMEYPETIKTSAVNQDPSVIAKYVYELVRNFNQFYQSVPILSAPSSNLVEFRISLSDCVAKTIKSGCYLLGIEVPERM